MFLTSQLKYCSFYQNLVSNFYEKYENSKFVLKTKIPIKRADDDDFVPMPTPKVSGKEKGEFFSLRYSNAFFL
jgi:hypothetical protein